MSDQPTTLDDSLKFILETLDHGKIIYNLKTIDQLHICIKTIKTSTISDIYSRYNKLKSNISIMTMFSYLNFLISDNIMTYFMDSLPSSINKKFDSFKLPPLSNPEDTIEVNGNQKHEQLFQLQLDILSLINEYLPLESNSYNSGSSTISDKLIIIFHEQILMSILSSLLCAQIYLESQKNDVYIVIHTLLNSKYNQIPQSRLWISLINTANDICFDDLRHIKLFIDLFQDQINRDPNVLNDDLIKGGLQYFIETFQPHHKWFEDYKQDDTFQELDAGNFKFLYSS